MNSTHSDNQSHWSTSEGMMRQKWETSLNSCVKSCCAPGRILRAVLNPTSQERHTGVREWLQMLLRENRKAKKAGSL